MLERCIGFEPWDLFPLTLKCYGKCLQNYKGTIFDVAWTEKYRFEIINAVTDEPKGTIFSVISLIISTDQRYWTERSPVSSWWAGHLRGKLKRPLTSSRVNHWEIALYSSFFRLVKDIREKSMEKSLFFFLRTWSNPDYILTMGSFVQVTSYDLRVDNKLFERWNYDIMISLNRLFRTLLWFFSLSRHGRKHWFTRLQCGGDKSLLIISCANF